MKGASQGEGLGNKFLTHIREVDAIVQVVRCFEDADIHHVSGTIDPVRDIEMINTELMLADLESVQKRRERLAKDAKRGDKAAVAEDAVLAKIEAALDAGKPALTVELTPEERALSRAVLPAHRQADDLRLQRRRKPISPTADTNPYVQKVREYVQTHLACEAVVISAQIESDLVDLSPDEADGVPEGARRAGERHRRADPRDLSPARPADLLHRRREGSPRLDHPRRRHRAARPPASSTPTSSAASSRPRPSPTTTW